MGAGPAPSAGPVAAPSAGGGRLLGVDDRSYSAPDPSRPTEPGGEPDGPRRVRLTVARVDPWSAMKLSFLLSVAFAIATVVASVVVWEVLDTMGVFDALNSQLRDIAGPTSKFDLSDYIGLGRVVAIATVVSLVNVVVTMALATLGAVLYNLSGSLVGGLNVTLTDD
jgi:hypothetical protein